ncbi:hypothetical protein Sjap_000962 [Stephania japonica]|uniref:non-specific serine/threonine protein kinase n=1 Tax=Stephania japonica TaxID=461633 RepID=A0AAP0KLD5_9MAGN
MTSTEDGLQGYDPELVAEPINARSKSFVGTNEYLAPEMISRTGHGSAVDWWTFRVFLYEMLYGVTPFKGENSEKTLTNIMKKPLTFPSIINVNCSSGKEVEEIVKAQDLISKLLVKNPKKRIGSLKGSVEIKQHEFFKDVDWALIKSVRPPEGIANKTVLFVGELEYLTTDAQIEEQVQNYGATEVRFFTDVFDGISKDINVKFQDTDHAMACMEGMDGHVVNGKPYTVSFEPPDRLWRKIRT